jgi:hypothetical protein
MSDSRRSKRNGDNDVPGTRSRSDSIPSSTSKRKSSKRSDPDRDGGFNPTSTSFSSTSQSPYPGMAAPSVASSYATANTTNPTSLPYKSPDLIRNESMKDQRVVPTSDTGRESRKKRDSERRRDGSSDSDNTKASRPSKRSDKDERRRSSKRDEKPKRTDSERGLDNHRASMVENQFPGEFPSTFAEPYRPPGLAADYYGDHGESVADQPGVRPAPPSIIIAADQAHLHEATIEAAPPPEPSSLGQLGAAASFYGGTSDFESDPPPKPSKTGNRPNLKPVRRSSGGTSPKSPPGPEGRSRPVPYSATGVGPAAMAAGGVGEAAEYFSTQFRPDLAEGGSNMASSGYAANQSTQNPSQGMQKPTQGMQNSTPGVIRPPMAAQRPSSGSNMPMYGAAAAGIAAVGAGAYYAGHHTTEEHHSMDNLAAGSYGPQTTGQFPSTPQNYHSQPPMQQRRRRRGPFSKIVDFFQDPSAVAEYEAYTEAIGVCKYCFDPGSSPRDAPRKHHYNPRYSDGRYGSGTRVDKLSRYQSSEDEKRRRSNGKKWVATGLAGYGLAKMSEAAINRKNDFDDTYSVKSGRPEGASRVSFAADERVSKSRRTRRSSVDDQSYSRHDSRRESDTKIRKDRRTGELYEERSSQRRDSNASDRFSKGAAISAGVAAAGLVAAASHRNRSRSNSPKKRYYSKRVSPNHSFVDLSASNSGALGFGSFFSSPSANKRKGKKAKGLGFFNFANASSSSSDADLAFGAGSVRRRKGRRDDRKVRDDGNVNAEILGLAATGVALAAEGDRQDRKGKRRADLMVVKEPRNDRSRRHDKKRQQSPPQSDEGNDDWIDASDDESSVDSALAYGGRLSTRQSRDSLASNDGTDKWAWRWNNGKKPRKKPSQDLSRYEPAVAGLAGIAIGEAAASSGRFGPTESTASIQSMQQLDPVPMSDTNAFSVDHRTSAISPRTGMVPPVLYGNMNSAPLEHPKPFAPISPAVYSSQASAPAPMYSPSGPPVFPQYPHQAPMTESPKQLPVGFETQRPRPDEKRRRRRNSSPTPSQIRDDEFDENSRRRPSTRDSVKFNLTEEQTEQDRRAQARQRRRSKREGRSDEKQADSPNFQQEASLEREKDEISSSRRSSNDARTAREVEIERELERLYEEDRLQKDARKSKRADTWPAAAAIGAGVAGVAAIVAAQSTSVEDESRPDREERQSRRKSALKQTTTPKTVNDDRSDSQQRRIAQMAAARVKSTPSPVHDDYASYFIPPELAEKVKEHNFAAEHRDDPTAEPAQIVEVAPRSARRKDTFDPFVYRPFGIEPEDDPTRYPWPVPFLDIIEPTPPVSVRGDMSPLPSKSPEPPEVPEVPEIIPEKKQKRSSSVTWGEHRTHEYEVITPLEDHEEFVRTATYESSQPAIDLAERTHSDVKPELSEPVTVSVRTNGVPHPSAEKDVPGPAPVVDEPQPKANYGQDLEFAAVLAAAAEGAGFDPSIVVNDPTYHRRDSPPGSEAASLYRSPFAETASDLGTFHDYSMPPQRGFVEGEIPPTPADEVSNEGLEAGRGKDYRTTTKDEQSDVEPKVPGGFSVFDYLDDSTAEGAKSANTKATEDPTAVSLGEEDSKRRKNKDRSSEKYTPAIESVRSQSIESEPSRTLKRSSTLDEVSFEASLEASRPQVSYASDPEGFDEKTRSKKKSSRKSNRPMEAVIVGAAATAGLAIDELVDSDRRRRKLEREDDDYYEKVPPVSASEPGADTSVDFKKSRRKPKRDGDIWDDTKSVASSPAELRDDRESSKKSKKKSKRDSAVFDDDTMSVSSLPADLNGDKAPSRKSKEKKSGGFFGLFSSSKSETSTSQKRSSREMDLQSRNGRDTKSEDLDEPTRKSKRKSKDKDLYDASSDLQRSRSDSQHSVRDDVRQQSPEDEFVSSEEARDNERTEDGMSFLGERPEMPTVLDGASGSIPETQLEVEQDISAQLPPGLPDPVSSTMRSRSVSPRTTPATVDEHETTRNEAMSPSAQRDQFRQRHLAEIRTSDIFSSPLATSSPTAVPLHFRRLPVSPSLARPASVGSISTGSPMSPLAASRTRQSRPTSTEFRNSKEFRPLYLVERHSSIKQPEPEVEETYPSLPSSRTSSAHPSMENLRGDDQGELFAEQPMSPSQIRDGRHSFSYWRDDRPRSPDYLDSRTATPTATEFPKEVKREKPKYEFHSPSELLEDPSRQLVESQEHQSPILSPMVLPSVGSPASSVAKNDYGASSSRPSSPTRDQQSADHKSLGTSIGLGLAGSAAAALVASQLIEHEETAAVTAEEPLSARNTPQDLSPPSATSAPPSDENTTPIDLPTSREIELSSAPQAVDNEFALQPVSSKKSRKDKKKKRKTLDLADESIDASSSSLDAREEPENINFLGARSGREQVPASEANERDLPSDSTVSEVSFLPQPEREVLNAQASASAKGPEVENIDIFATSHIDEQTLPEPRTGSEIPISAAEINENAVSLTPEPEVVAPAVPDTDTSSQITSIDKSSFVPDMDLTRSGILSLPEEKIETQVRSNKESMPAVSAELVQHDRNLSFDSTLGALDDTDRTEGLEEKASRDSYPFDEPVAVPEVDTATLSWPSPLEEAFAKAEAARGTAPDVSEEEAFKAFRPRASLEPSPGYGRLDTIVEGSREGSRVDLAQVEEAVEASGKDQAMPSRSKSNKDKKSRKSRDFGSFDAKPEATTGDDGEVSTQEETEITKDPVASGEPVETVAISDPSINPFGDDYVLPREDNIDSRSADTSRELDKVDALQLEGASAAATPLRSPVPTASAPRDLDESVQGLSWAQTSKKDKKKGKKGRTSALISDASTPVTEMSSMEGSDQPEAKSLDPDSFAVPTKKGKKGKKKAQVLDWAVEDANPKQEEVLEEAEEPVEKVTEIEQDPATQQRADDFSAAGGKRAKKIKKKSQALDCTDEATTPLAEESIDTVAENQRDAPTAEAESEDLNWATTMTSKKEEKKKSKKSALLNETPPEIDVVPDVEPISMPAMAEEQVPAVNDEPRVSAPEVRDEAALTRDEPPIPAALDEASLPRDVVSIPRDEASIPRGDAAMPRGEAPLPQHDQHASEPAEPSELSAPEPHDQQVPEPVNADDASGLQEIHAIPEPHEVPPQAPKPVNANDASGLQETHAIPEPHEVPPQAPELVKATTLASVPSNDRETPMVRDLYELPEPSEVLRQIPEVDEDHEASTLRDSRWASVFGELKERKVSAPSEVPRQIPEVDEDHEASTLRDSRWGSVFGELMQRKVSEPTRKDNLLVPVPDVAREKQVSVPAGAAQQIDIPGEKIETAIATTAIATDSMPDHEQMNPQTHESSPGRMPPSQVEPSAEHLQAYEQADHAAIEEQASHADSQPVAVAQDMHDQIHEAKHAAQESAMEILSRTAPEQHEAILSDNRELSDHRLEPEFHKGTQPETTTKLERPDEAETPADAELSNAPIPVVEEQADEFLLAPAKKGKKGKKSKSKQSTFLELADPASDSSRSKDVIPDGIVAGAAMEAETETPPIATPAEKSNAEADAFSWGPTKKSKKDKKKRKSLPFGDETSTPASDDLGEGQSSIPWPASLAHLANDTDAEKPISEKANVAKDINAEDEIQSQIEDISTLPKREEDSSLISATPEQRQPVLAEDEPIKENREFDAARTTEDKALVAEPDIMQEEPAVMREEPATIEEEPDEHFWAATPKKKGKKDKKKRGSVLETSGTATPQTEEEQPLAEDTLNLAATPEAALAKEDEWALSTKKSKKDKKKKKTAFSSLGDVDEPEPEADIQATRDTNQSIGTEIDRDTVEQTQADVLATPIANLETEERAVGPSATEPAEAAKTEEDLQGTRDVRQGDEPEIEQNILERPQADGLATAIAEQAPEERLLDHSAPELAEAEGVGSATEHEPIVAVSRSEAIIDRVKEQPMFANKSTLGEEPILELKPTAATEVESSWAPVPKESKKERKDKKKRKSTVVLEELLEDSSSPANASDSGKTETAQYQDRDLKVLAESDPTSGPNRAAEAETITETKTIIEPESNAEQHIALATETTEEPQQPVLPVVAEPEAAPEDDAWAFTTKRSKKEKKTKRNSVVDPDEPTIGTIGATAAAAGFAASDHMQGDTEKAQAQGPALGELREAEKAPLQSSEPSGLPESVQDVDPVVEPEEDTWGFSTKKTKKDKKKKRQSTFDEHSSAPSAPATPSEHPQADKDIVISGNEPVQNLTSEKNKGFESEERALTAAAPIAQIVEDDFATTGKKKSKKDKKKKKALLSWGEENDTSTDQPTEASTPVNEPELGTSGEQLTAMERTEEPKIIPDAESVDLGSSQVLESALVSESSLPAVQQHFSATEAPIVDPTYSNAQELAAGGNTLEAEEDGQWGFSTAKKNRKTKKGKKGRQDFNSREEAQSRSFSIPGAFEDEAESGSQSFKLPEVANVKEEQTVPLVTEEPEMTTDVTNAGDAVEFITKPSKKGKKGKKGRQSSYLASDDTYPTDAISEHAVTEGDALDRGQPEEIGVGIGAVVSQAAALQATGDLILPHYDEPLGQHEVQPEAQHFAVHEQAIRDHGTQHERALLPSHHSSELPPVLEALETRPLQSTWSFANLKKDTMQEHANRDSGIQVSDSPFIQAGHLQPTLRDSGYVPSPIAAASREVSAHEDAHSALARPPRPISPTSSSEDLRQKSHDHSRQSYQPETTRETDDPALLPPAAHRFHDDQSEVLARGHPSPVDSTTKDRSSALFNSSPSNRTDTYGATPRLDTRHMQAPITDLHRSPSIHGHRSREDLRSLTPSHSPTRHHRQMSDAPIAEPVQEVSQQPHRSIFGPFSTSDEHDRGLSPPRTPLQTIHEHVPDTSPSNRRRRPLSDVGSPDRGHKSVQRSSAPALGELDSRLDAEHPRDAVHTQIPAGHPSAVESERESQSAAGGNHSRALAEIGAFAGVAGAGAIATEELRQTSRDNKSWDTKSLGKSKSRSTSSKQLRRSQASLENIASSSTHDPVREKGKAAARDMADVYVSIS